MLIFVVLLLFQYARNIISLDTVSKNISKKLLLRRQCWKYCTYLDLESTENFHTMNNTYRHSRKTLTWNQQQTSAFSPPTPHNHYLNSSKSSHCQKSGNPIKHICGLGASVGYERIKRVFNTPRLKSQICFIWFPDFVSP